MREINARSRFLYLFFILVAVSTCVGGAAVFLLYNTSFEAQRDRLVDIARSQARLIEAVARFDNNADATLSQLVDAHKHYQGFGETGEFTLAKLEGNTIVFLLSHRHDDLDNPRPVSLGSDLAEPMRRALLKKSGTLVGKDYRGETVLAAYEAVAGLNYGIVAKMDRSEIRKPFIQAGITAAIANFLFIGLGAFLFMRITGPMLSNLEQKNTLLQREIAERIFAQEQVTASLEEKNIMLQEIHHRVKNNMAMVSSLLHLQALEIENTEDRQRFIDTQNRIYTMALVHEKLYGTKNFSKINFDTFIQDLAEAISLSYSIACEVALSVDADNVFLDLNKAIPCGLFINELISNCYKHAFSGKEQGEIAISFYKNASGQFEFMISDDGVGLPDGFDMRTNRSMGIQLIHRLAGQLDGTVANIDNTLFATGTAFKVIF